MGQADPIGKEVLPEDKKAILETIEHCPTEAIRIEDIKEGEN